MKTFFALFAFLACMIAVLAVPTDQNSVYIRSAAGMALDNVVIVDMTVYDDRFPGVAFTGTAESVFQQMKALKPEEFNDDFETPGMQSLAAQAKLDCEWGVDPHGLDSCNANRNHLYKLGRANCCVDGGNQKCARVGCSYTCGSFLCNKTDGQICFPCVDIGHDLDYIMDVCGHNPWDVAAGKVEFDDHWVGQKKTDGC